MLKKIVMAGIACCTLVAHVPAAQALAVTGGCDFATVADEDVTGDNDTFTGVAFGYAVSDAPALISVHCEVRINGGAIASTPPGPLGQASFTAGQVTYTANDTDTVTVCAVWLGTENGEFCSFPTAEVQLGLLGCTLVFVSRISSRPFPNSPNDVVPYVLATVFDGVEYVLCIVF